jgi:hypothetical protein
VVLPELSTNYSRMHEYRGVNSSIRGPFVDGLQSNHKINQNQGTSFMRKTRQLREKLDSMITHHTKRRGGQTLHVFGL